MNTPWWKNKDNTPSGKNVFHKARNIAIISIIAVIAFSLLSTMWYTVNDKQQAVVTTFGKVTDITGPGMHLKLPFGIQHARTVDVNIFQKIELGYRTLPDGTTQSVNDESEMITGDYNIVNVDFFVEYKISDPQKYIYNSENPNAILKNLAQSQIRNVISSYDVDKILTTGKNEIQAKIKDSITEGLTDYNLGLLLTDVKIQDSEPPTKEVKEAFKEVETAKQDKETAINVAQAYENAQLPKAQAEADKLIQNAEYLKQNRINEANMQVSMFNGMFGQYAQNPAITKSRMYYEAIEAILPGVKVYLDTSSNGATQKLLPLESFNSLNNGGQTK
jgi:HflK protein